MIAALVFAFIVTHFPDNTDSIGRPDIPYRGTCFVRCEAAEGQSVYCHAAQAIGRDGTPTDCAAHCRHQRDRLQIPLPYLPGVAWRQAQSQWCLFVRETVTGVYHWPSCHAENYQMMSLGKFGPADVECDYLTLPVDVGFEYTEELPPQGSAGSAAGAFVVPPRGLTYRELRDQLRGKGQRVKKGKGPGSYVVRTKARRGQQ